MEGKTFFDHYRICTEGDEFRVEISRSGPAITYKASDSRSGAPVALTLIPKAGIDPAAHERLAEKARAAEQLDHLNVAKIVASGFTDDEFAFVSEYPQGETVESWVVEHGPMPPDAVLRIALQVVSALGVGRFQGLTHPAIQPSNLMIVPGKTGEGGWPLVKLMNFGLAGLSLAPDGEAEASEFASPKQLGEADFRSEIYSLGGTMCFLLTGAYYSAEPRSLQTRRFARPLRNLIAPMLRQNPDERPQDPTLFALALRSGLQNIERRQGLARRLGIPFVPVRAAKPVKPPAVSDRKRIPIIALVPVATPPPSQPPPLPEPLAVFEPVFGPTGQRSRFPRRAWAIAAVVVGLAIASAFLLPAPASMILHRNRDRDTIGVPVGVAVNSPPSTVQNARPTAAPLAQSQPVPSNGIASSKASTPSASVAPAVSNSVVAVRHPGSPSNQVTQTPVPVATVAGQSASPSSTQSAPPMVASASRTSPDASVAEPDVSSGPRVPDIEPPPPAQGPQTIWERAGGPDQKLRAQNSTSDAVTPADDAMAEPSDQTSTPPASTKRTVSKSHENLSGAASTAGRESTTPKRERIAQGTRHRPVSSLPPLRRGMVRAEFVGITPSGNLILRLPSGRTTIVQRPPADFPHRRVRHVVIERPALMLPPYFPGYPID